MRVPLPARPCPRRRRDRRAGSPGAASCSPCRPSSSLVQMNGSTKLAVPTCTALAPASMNSSTSRASMMPPMPMIGIFTSCRHSHTIRTAIGRIAGPLSPPTTFESFGPPLFHVDGHGQERVHERDGVGAGVFGRARERRRRGDVGRQLRNHRQRGHLADRAHHAERAIQAAAELDAAFLDVGTRDVHFEGGDALGVRQDARHLHVLVERRAADVHDGAGAALAQQRQLLADEAVHADALQADGVQHARRASRRCAPACGPDARPGTGPWWPRRRAATGRRRLRIRGRSRSTRSPR